MHNQQDGAMITVSIGGTFRLEPFLPGLEELIDDIREQGHDGRISYRPPTGYGVTLYQTVTLYIEHHAADATVGLIVTSLELAVINWAKRLFHRAKDSGGHERKKFVTILGPDGKPLK